MRKIIDSSLKFRLVVLGIGAATLFLGIPQLRAMPADVLPEFLPPTVVVQTEALGLSAVEMEQLVTIPLENYLLNGVAWLDTIRSESLPGLSSVELIFEPGTELMRARQVVQERLTQAHALPNVSKPPQMLQPVSSTNRVTMIGLSSTELSLIDLSVLSRWTIKPRLMGVPGVANVSIFGQRERQLQVQVDPARLRRLGVSLQQVIATTGNALWVSPLSFLEASTPGSGGFIETPNQRLGIRHVLPIASPKDLARVVVEDLPRGRTLRLGDVASVIEDHQPLIGDATIDDGRGLMLVIEKFPSANTIEVTRGVEEALEAMKPGLQGVTIEPAIYRPANYIEDALGNVRMALVIGLLLALVVVAGMTGSWRRVVMALTALVLSLVAATIAMGFLGETLNAMVIAGIVIALVAVLDDAIVDPGIIATRIRERRATGDTGSTFTTIARASMEMRRPMLFASFVVLFAAVPLFFAGGLVGAFLPSFATAALVGLGASMLVALTVTPALALVLFREGTTERAWPVADRIRAAYARALAPGRAFVVLGAIGLAGLLAVPFLRTPQSTMPTFQERDLLIEVEGVAGTSATEMNRITGQMSAELRAIDGVRNVDGHVGRALMSDQVASVNTTELWVGIEPFADHATTLAAIRDTIAGYPGLDTEVLSFPNERVREVLTGAEEPVAVRVYGEDYPILRAKASEVRDVIAPIPGIVDLEVEAPIEEPNVEITVDLEAARRYRIKPGDVRRAATTLLSGIEVGNLFEEQKVFEVVVWGVPRVRNSVPVIRDLLIRTPSGRHVRLDQVADIRIAPSPRSIEHEGTFRHIDVVANVQGRDVGDALGDVERALAQVSFPLEYHAELVGEHGERRAARNGMIAMAIATAVGVLLLLQAAFRSWRMAAVAFVALVSSLAGGAVAVLATGRTLSLGASIGFVGVLAIGARQIIVLVERFRRLELQGEPIGTGLVTKGAAERVVPLLTSAAALLVAILPFLISGTVAGLEVLRPMTAVLFGGAVSATLVTLFAVPGLYERFGFIHEDDPWADEDVIVLPDGAVRAQTGPTTTLG